jgi:uncharacterized protein (TIGR00661 family)
MEKVPLKTPTILVCPLDWGIGHATRCVPVIKILLAKGANVIIAADGRPLLVLQQEFPQLVFANFPGYRFSYPHSGSMALKMLIQVPGILQGIRKENKMLQALIDKFHVDAVISDNRFGVFSTRIPSVFITHQLFIRTKWTWGFLEPLLNVLNWRYISRFDACWIPDFEGEDNLSGMLSHYRELPDRFCFIGPQSRFGQNDKSQQNQQYDVLALLSGPEPQRTILQEKLIPMLNESGLKCGMVLGTPEKKTGQDSIENLTLFHHLDSESLQNLILSSEIVISRSGYSTVMDLAALGKKAIFIPTPGQTEQEYLAKYFKRKKIFYSEKQDDFNLARALQMAKSYPGLSIKFDDTTLESRIDALIGGCMHSIGSQ